MSVAVYHEPYRMPAGILALAVHGAFFALLYFGFSWQAQPAGTMSVELWKSLPDKVVAPPAKPKPKVEEVVPPPQPEKVVEPEMAPPQQEKIIEPEIVLPDKKKVEVKQVEVKPKKKVDTKSAEKAKAERVAEQAAREQAEQAARARAEQAAAVGRMVDEYTGKIIRQIRRNIYMPPDVADDARAEFLVTLLPGGTILSAQLVKSSGNAAYDNAVERAILKSQPLPLPADVALFSRFRKLELVFKPIE